MRLHHCLVSMACALLVLPVSGCGPLSSAAIGHRGVPSTQGHPSQAGGPPPHAPAHGYRHKQHHSGSQVELVFDGGLGVYLVVGMPDYYYWNGYYLRIEGNRWYASAELDGVWKPRDESTLPPGLQKKGRKAKGKPHKAGKTHPAKKSW